MQEKIISLNDKHSITDLINDDHNLADRLGGKVKKTRITITDHDTGEVLGEYENKVVISGSMFSACKVFGIDTDLILPSYNFLKSSTRAVLLSVFSSFILII